MHVESSNIQDLEAVCENSQVALKENESTNMNILEENLVITAIKAIQSQKTHTGEWLLVPTEYIMIESFYAFFKRQGSFIIF